MTRCHSILSSLHIAAFVGDFIRNFKKLTKADIRTYIFAILDWSAGPNILVFASQFCRRGDDSGWKTAFRTDWGGAGWQKIEEGACKAASAPHRGFWNLTKETSSKPLIHWTRFHSLVWIKQSRALLITTPALPPT